MDDHTVVIRSFLFLRNYRYLFVLVLMLASLSSTPKSIGAYDSSHLNKPIESSQTIYLPIIETAWPFTPITLFKTAPRFTPQLTINGRFDNLGKQTYDQLLIIVNLADNRPQPLFNTITITTTSALSYSLPGQPAYFSTAAYWPMSDPPPAIFEISVRAIIAEAHVTTETILALTTVLTQSTNMGNTIKAYAEFRNDTPFVLTDTKILFANLFQLSSIAALPIEGPIQPGQIISATQLIGFDQQLTGPNVFFEAIAQGRAVGPP